MGGNKFLHCDQLIQCYKDDKGRRLTGSMRKNYFSLNLGSVITDGKLPFPLYMKINEHTANRSRYQIVVEEQEQFPRGWFNLLHSNRINRLYFEEAHLGLAIEYLNNHLTVLGNSQKTSAHKLPVLYDHLCLICKQVLKAMANNGLIDRTLEQIDDILRTIEKNQLLLKFLWKSVFSDYRLYSHIANVFIISQLLMLHLQKNHDSCRIMAVASLCHDIGMTHLPSLLVNKPVPLNPMEREKIESHPQISFDILKTHGGIPADSLQLVMEHHENGDGSGYPQGLLLNQQHPLSQVIRLADAYSALVNKRPYRSAYSPREAIKILAEDQGPFGAKFDQSLLNTFANLLSF